MRMRSIATTALLAAALGLGGATAAHASDPDPTTGSASDSPGLLSGNVVQVPVEVQVNVCGDTIDLIGLLDPATGNTCVNQ
ncbi:chaplin [Streptomyces sp. NPDC051452]|uniref:chaplin n=1 Tax=Streptomyces sp. NPDC051452 TaxID=3365654 RepID=UPI0037B785CD